MKRGLVVLDPAETSPAVFASRLNAVRERLKDSSAHLALIYGDVSRSGDIQYLTGLCLYWNEAVLAVPLQSRPVLITKLSKRVQPWMHRTSTLEDIRSAPRLVESVGKLLDELPGGRSGRIALVDMSWWPNEIVARLRRALPEMELKDLPGIVREHRLAPPPEEVSLLQRGAQLLEQAMAIAWAQGGNAHERTSIAVRYVRRAGFLDATVNCGKLQDGSEFADAIGQYRYVWVRQSRPRGGPLADVANGALRVVLDAAKPGATEAQLGRVAAGHVGDRYRPALSCIPHPDIETRGLFRAVEDTQRPLKDGEVACVTLSLASEVGVLAAAETVKITRGGAVPLSGRESE